MTAATPAAHPGPSGSIRGRCPAHHTQLSWLRSSEGALIAIASPDETTMIRADAPGSLLRPTYLQKARAALASGELTMAAFRRIEDQAVDEAIALQEDAGLDVVTDGEMRRADFMAPLYEAVHGVQRYPGRALTWTHGVTGDTMTWRIPFRITGRIRQAGSPSAAAYAYARARGRRPVKQSLPSPLLANWAWDADSLREIYGDPFEMLADAAGLVREQARELADLGCTYIQIALAFHGGSAAEPRA